VSVLEQRYPNLEYFVMDGGSNDGSLDVIRKYAKYLTYWQSRPDGGQVRAINAGLCMATGEILTFLNSDDFLLQGAIEMVVEAYRAAPSAAGWVGTAHAITYDGYILKTRVPTTLARQEIANWAENWFRQPACFFSGKLSRRTGYFDPAYRCAFDFDLWMRLTQLAPFVPVHSILAAARVDARSKTRRFRITTLEETRAIQRKFGYEALAAATDARVRPAERETPVGAVAKLMYVTAMQKRRNPDRYVRMPVLPKQR